MGFFDFVDDITGPVISAVGGGISSALGLKWQQDSQGRQLDWLREHAQNQHQWEMEDLKKAGLNPILAASHGPIGTSVPQAITPEAQGHNITEAAMRAMQLILEKQRLANETASVSSSVALNDAKRGTENAQAELFRANSAVAAEQARNLEYERTQFHPQKARESQAMEKYHYSASSLSETQQKLNSVLEQLEKLKIPVAQEEAKRPETTYVLKHAPGGGLGVLGYLIGKIGRALGSGIKSDPSGMINKHVPPSLRR